MLNTKNTLAALALALTLGTAAARDEPMMVPDRITLPAKPELNEQSLRQAFVRGGARRNWTVLSDAPGKLQLKQSRNGKHEATVKISYDANSYQLSYANSYNLNYDEGRKRIHPTYNMWLRNLSGDIASEVMLIGPGPR